MPERPGEFVRSKYGVPAYIGRRIAFTYPENHRRHGKITGFRGPHLLVKFDDEKRGTGTRLHPTWEIEYLPVGGPDA